MKPGPKTWREPPSTICVGSAGFVKMELVRNVHFVEASTSATLTDLNTLLFFFTRATGPESAFGFTHPEDAQNSIRIQKNFKFSQNIKPNVTKC